jgi:hypothetical protein
VPVLGCGLRGFSPIFSIDVDRKADVIGLNSLLAAHFAPQALDELVVTRRDTLGFAEQAEQLVRLGLSARKGVLPPACNHT